MANRHTVDVLSSVCLVWQYEIIIINLTNSLDFLV